MSSADEGHAIDAAEQAFKDLRDEVATLRQTVTVEAAVAGQADIAPDYSPSVGAITKELQAVTRCLARIEADPAPQLTPGAADPTGRIRRGRAGTKPPSGTHLATWPTTSSDRSISLSLL